MKVIMKKNAYGFGMDWTLSYRGKEFYLGQDVKVCSRLLGTTPLYLIEQISKDTGLSFAKCRDVKDNKRVNTRLAQIIVASVPDIKSANNSWDLAVD